LDIITEEEYRQCTNCPRLEKKIDTINLALLGSDGTGLHGGIAQDIHELKEAEKVQNSWTSNFKPIFMTVITTVLVFSLTWLLTHLPVG
jgi:O-antigen/teichoic acid export membrane protein